MANKTLSVEQIKNELFRYVTQNPKLFRSAILSKKILLNQYARTVTKVKGHYPSVQSLMTHVVQIFDSKKFTPFGEIKFLNKNLTNYHQKVDFILDPAEILGTIFEEMYEEGKKIPNKSISQLAMKMLAEQIIDDVDILSITGKYDATQKGSDTPVFGTSMNGLNEIHSQISTDTDNPVFIIPGNAITQSNILDEVTSFEKGLPAKAKSKVKYLMMNDVDAEDYQLAYEDRFGQNKFQDNATRTRIGKRKIIGVPNLTPGTIVSSVDKNLLRLIDEIDNPSTITDVQVENRIMKVLGEFSLGYDYGINQLVYMHSSDASKERGLNNTEQNDLFYASEKLG